MPKVYQRTSHSDNKAHLPQPTKPIQTLLTWQAPMRPFHKRDSSYYRTIIIIVVLVSLIALLTPETGGMLLVGVLLAMVFVIYVLNFIPPEDISYKISTQGVTIGDHFYHWQELDSFWVSEKDGHKILSVVTHLHFPALLMLLLNPEVDTEEVKEVVAEYLPFHEIPPKSWMDKWSDRLQKYFYLQKPSKSAR